MTQSQTNLDELQLELDRSYKPLTKEQLADKAQHMATQQIMASSQFKKPRITRLNKYWELYDGKVAKKLRQLFNVPIPVFPGMIDTLNAQYDTPIQLKFGEGDAADYFAVQKINAAWQMEVLDTSQNSKWDSKLAMARKHAIMNGRGILEYSATSDPEYHSELNVINLKHFNFQPAGGLYLENHLFAGTEDIEKTADQIIAGAQAGIYDKNQVKEMFARCQKQDYMPFDDNDISSHLDRFKPLGLDANGHNYIGSMVYKLASQIVQIDGKRYYICFHPWTKTWLRFEKWEDIDKSDLYPWVSFATHEDDENFLSKSYADDLYPAADAILAMFNQELTNREKRNFGARAYDKDMFTDVRKLDEAMHRPDALVPVDTKGGTRRISEGIYEFKFGELGGTVNLIDWISGTLGRNTGATDLASGSVSEVSKKASVTFAEQRAVSKRISWSSQPFQTMMGELGKRYVWGLKNHMPSSMAIRLMGEGGWDWEEITRLDLNTRKDVNVTIISTEAQMRENEAKAERRREALTLLAQSPHINGQRRDAEILKTAGYSEQEIEEFLDVKTYRDRNAISKASQAIQLILRGQKPELWYGANVAFIQKIVDYANDKRSTLKDKFEVLMDYAMSHTDIAKQNIERKVLEERRAKLDNAQDITPTAPAPSTSVNEGIPGGMSRAMQVAEAAV